MVLGDEWGCEVSDMAIRAAIVARPGFCWKGSCSKLKLINCFSKKKEKQHTAICATIRGQADPLTSAWSLCEGQGCSRSEGQGSPAGLRNQPLLLITVSGQALRAGGAEGCAPHGEAAFELHRPIIKR